MYEGTDFEADIVGFYSNVRNMMSAMYPPSDFGPREVLNCDTDSMTREELMEHKRMVECQEKQIKEGYKRVQTKIKELNIS